MSDCLTTFLEIFSACIEVFAGCCMCRTCCNKDEDDYYLIK